MPSHPALAARYLLARLQARSVRPSVRTYVRTSVRPSDTVGTYAALYSRKGVSCMRAARHTGKRNVAMETTMATLNQYARRDVGSVGDAGEKPTWSYRPRARRGAAPLPHRARRSCPFSHFHPPSPSIPSPSFPTLGAVTAATITPHDLLLLHRLSVPSRLFSLACAPWEERKGGIFILAFLPRNSRGI